MAKTDRNIGNLTVGVKLDVDYNTAVTCLQLVEYYLNQNDDQTLTTYCDKEGNWDLGFAQRDFKG